MKTPREVRDINGIVCHHGDRVITIRKNGKAVGGDLVVAYLKDVYDDGILRLVDSMGDSYPSYSFYSKLTPAKLIKL